MASSTRLLVSLLCRVRHTDSLIISDIGFPYVPHVETIDISLISGMPRVLDVVRAARMEFHCSEAVMSTEFREVHTEETLQSYEEALQGASVTWESHMSFKAPPPMVIGIVRTGDTTRFGNVLLES